MAILNVELAYTAWKQACQPVRRGSVGIRKTSYENVSAFLASTYACSNLVPQILSPVMAFQLSDLAAEVIAWQHLSNGEPPVNGTRHIQKAWDLPVVHNRWAELVAGQATGMLATIPLLATATKESVCWLNE